MDNPALVGSGLRDLKETLSKFNKGSALSVGAASGLIELATGGSKLKAVIESIKWAAFARAGVAGFMTIVPAALALTVGIRNAVKESGILQAAMKRLSETKILTTQFTAFLGSVQLARQRVGELYAFVANSKFDMSEAANASKVLTIMTNGAEGGIKSLQELGKVASATGTSLQEIALLYAKFADQAKKGESIAGTVGALRELGVVSESTANNLINLQRSGASASDLMVQLKGDLNNVASATKDTGDSVEDLQNKLAKLKEEAAAGFGKAWTGQEKKDLENQIKLWTGISGATERFGTNLEFVTGSTDKLKNKVYDLAGTDAFKSSLKSAADMVFVLPAAIAGLSAIKSILKGEIPGKRMFESAKTAFNILKDPAAATTRAGAAFTGGKFATGVTAEVAEATAAGLPLSRGLVARKAIVEGTQKSISGAASGLSATWRGLTAAGGFLLRAVPWIAAATVVTMGLGKAWGYVRDKMDRAENAAKTLKEALDIREEVAAQIKDVKTLDDKTTALANAHEMLNEAIKKRGEARGDSGSTSKELQNLNTLVEERRSALLQIQGINEKNLGMTQKEYDYRQRQIAVEQQIADIQYRAQMARSNAVQQDILATQKLDEIQKKIKERVAEREAGPEIEEAEKGIARNVKNREVQTKALESEKAKLAKEAGEIQDEINRQKISRGGPGPQTEIKKGELKKNQEEQLKLQEKINDLKKPNSKELELEARKAALIDKSNSKILAFRKEAEAADKRNEIRLRDELRLKAATLSIEAEEDLKIKAAEIKAEEPERKRAAGREIRDYDTSIKYRDLMNRSMEAAAKGNFALAAATQKMANDLEKANTKKNRVEQLEAEAGIDKAQALVESTKIEADKEREKAAFIGPPSQGPMQGPPSTNAALIAQQFEYEMGGNTPGIIAERKAKAAYDQIKRDAKAKADQEEEQRKKQEQIAKDAKMEEITRGIEMTKLAAPGAGMEAKRKLATMQDEDALKKNYQEMTQGMGDLTAEEQAKLWEKAKEKTAADVGLLEGAGKDTGAVASSLTAIGGGGGYYAGGGPADGAKEIAARQSEIMSKSKDSLGRIEEALVKNGILIKGGIKQ